MRHPSTGRERNPNPQDTVAPCTARPCSSGGTRRQRCGRERMVRPTTPPPRLALTAASPRGGSTAGASGRGCARRQHHQASAASLHKARPTTWSFPQQRCPPGGSTASLCPSGSNVIARLRYHRQLCGLRWGMH